METDLKVGLFDYINSLTTSKQDLSTMDPEFEKNYNPFMVCRGLSNNVSDVLWANALNLYHAELTKKQHYDFLFHALKPSKRYSKWSKEKKDEETILVSEYLGINRDEAESFMALMSPEELEEILKFKGGKIKK